MIFRPKSLLPETVDAIQDQYFRNTGTKLSREESEELGKDLIKFIVALMELNPAKKD